MSLFKAAAAAAAARQFNACDFFGTYAKPFNLLPFPTQRRSKPANAFFLFFFFSPPKKNSSYYKNAESRLNGPVTIFNLVGLQIFFNVE